MPDEPPYEPHGTPQRAAAEAIHAIHPDAIKEIETRWSDPSFAAYFTVLRAWLAALRSIRQIPPENR